MQCGRWGTTMNNGRWKEGTTLHRQYCTVGRSKVLGRAWPWPWLPRWCPVSLPQVLYPKAASDWGVFQQAPTSLRPGQDPQDLGKEPSQRRGEECRPSCPLSAGCLFLLQSGACPDCYFRPSPPPSVVSVPELRPRKQRLSPQERVVGCLFDMLSSYI